MVVDLLWAVYIVGWRKYYQFSELLIAQFSNEKSRHQDTENRERFLFAQLEYFAKTIENEDSCLDSWKATKEGCSLKPNFLWLARKTSNSSKCQLTTLLTK